LRAALTTVLLFLVAADAHAATLRVADPAGDLSTFNTPSDLTALSVVWDQGALVYTATFSERPRTLTLDVIVSEASNSESDPSVHECEPGADDVVTMIGTNDGGNLEVYGVDGRLEVPSEWDGATVTYRFRHPTLDREFARRDPFACGSGTAGEDQFYGVFDGKVGKLTSAAARGAVLAEVRRRYGEGRIDANCPRRTIVAEGQPVDDARQYTAAAFCSFTRRGPRNRLGFASVSLEAGVPKVTGISSRTYPRSLQFCGINDFSSGWRQPPVLGASTMAWGRRTSCRTARRVALRWRGRSRVMGFRCRRVLRGAEFSAVRCRRGRALVYFETGS
jgi:hypothetical protein